MSSHSTFLLALVWLLLSCLHALSSVPDATKPNFIIFYVDDLGWQDVEKLSNLGTPQPLRSTKHHQAHRAGHELQPSLLTRPHPSRSNQIRFLVIDENNYQHFSELTVRSSKLTK